MQVSKAGRPPLTAELILGEKDFQEQEQEKDQDQDQDVSMSMSMPFLAAARKV
jgi:hypothetical protein